MYETALARGAYAITGGLGGLGLRAAALLVERGASQVVLASRSGRVARLGQALEAQLSSLRTVALVVVSDVGDVSDALRVAGIVVLREVLDVALARVG